MVTHQTIATTLVSGEDDTTWDGGIFESAAIGDRIWEDRNGDGKQGAGEPGLAGITVQLLDAKGAVIAITTTDANGHYLFDDLLPGEYKIRVLPATNENQA